MATACSATSDAVCGNCTATQRLPGGECNRCPNGTLLTTNSNGNTTCELCPAGFFCAPTASSTTSARRLLATSQCATGKTSGAGAVACVEDCGIGILLLTTTRHDSNLLGLTRLGLAYREVFPGRDVSWLSRHVRATTATASALHRWPGNPSSYVLIA